MKIAIILLVIGFGIILTILMPFIIRRVVMPIIRFFAPRRTGAAGAETEESGQTEQQLPSTWRKIVTWCVNRYDNMGTVSRVVIGIALVISAIVSLFYFRGGEYVLLLCSYFASRAMWRRITWPTVVRVLGDQGDFWVRVPHNRVVSIDKDRTCNKMIISTGQQQRPQFRSWCFEKNLKLIGRLAHKTLIFICGEPRVDYFVGSGQGDWVQRNRKPVYIGEGKGDRRLFDGTPVDVCRKAVEKLESGEVTVEELMKRLELRWLLKDYEAKDFDAGNHRKMRRNLFERDSRMFFLIPEGIGGLVPIPPFWIVNVRIFEKFPTSEEDRLKKQIREQRIKHSVDLREEVILFPHEDDSKRELPGDGMFVPNQATGDLVDVSVSISGDFIPVDPEKLLYKVSYPYQASFTLLLGPLGHVTRSLQIRQLIEQRTLDVTQANLLTGNRSKTREDDARQVLREGISEFQLLVKSRFAVEIGELRPFPKNWAKRANLTPGQIERASLLFPESLIPTQDYLRAAKTKGREEGPAAPLLKALGFADVPYVDKTSHLHWINHYLSTETPVGIMDNRFGLFARFRLADVEPKKEVAEQLLKQWLYKEFEARGNISLAEARAQEELLVLRGRALGLEQQMLALKRRGVGAVEAIQLIKYFERMRMLAGLPKNQNLTMFLGEEGTKPLGSEKEQLLFSLLAMDPRKLQRLLELAGSETMPQPQTTDVPLA